MRVLQVGKYYPPFVGGMENHLAILSEELSQQVSLRVVVSSVDGSLRREIVNGVDVLRLPNFTPDGSAPVSPLLVRILRGACADVVHIHSPNPAAEMAYLVARPRGRLVVTYHFDPERQRRLMPVYRRLWRRFAARASLLLTTSQRYAETSPLLRHLAVPRAVLPYGIDVDGFTDTPALRDRLSRLRSLYAEPLVLFVGRFSYYKGLDHLIRAMVELPEALALLVGSGTPETELRRLAAELGVGSRVVFVGEVPHEHLAPYFHACELLVLPSVHRSEAFGIVQLEAHASGKPVVSTNLDTGVPWVNEHEKTGLVVPPADVPALAGAIRSLLADPDRRKAMGRYARRRVSRQFSKETMAGAALALYQKALDGELAPVPMAPGR